MLNNFVTLYLFELKKIFKKKLTLAAIIIMMAAAPAGLAVSGFYQSDGGETEGMNVYERGKQMRAVGEALNGTPIDDAFLAKISNGSIKDTTHDRLIYYLLGGDYTKVVTAEEFYNAADEKFYEMLADFSLSDKERQFWSDKWERIERPYIYGYARGVENICNTFYSVSVFCIMFLAVCLCGIYAEEHQRRTDAMILSSKEGKSRLYFIKFLAGSTFGIVTTTIIELEFALIFGIIYGFGGGFVKLQVNIPYTPYDWTFSQFLLVMSALYIFSMLVVTAFVLMLSEASKNAVASMSAVVGILIVSMMFEMPHGIRILEQLWEYFPGRNLGIWSFINPYTVPLGFTRLNFYQSAILLYLILSVLFFFVGKRKYQRFQC